MEMLNHSDAARMIVRIVLDFGRTGSRDSPSWSTAMPRSTS